MAKRTATVKTPEVIDVGDAPTQSEDEQLVRTAGAAVGEFMLKVGVFFRKAETLERRALGTLAEAERFKANPPKTAVEDLAVQKLILRTGAENKEIVEHWKITTAINTFHKRMTGKRAIATKATDDANKIGNELHNAFVAAEAKRAAEETERLRKVAEAEEQARRDAELIALEEEAIRREEQAGELTAREQTFVDLYLVRGDGAAAAKGAGYKEPAKNAARLLTLPKITAALEAKKAAAAVRQQAEALKRQPILAEAPEVRSTVVQAAGSFDRTTHSAELLDEAALIEAIFSGRYGIPRTLLAIDRKALNDQAKDLKELINRWPGVRYKKDTRLY